MTEQIAESQQVENSQLQQAQQIDSENLTKWPNKQVISYLAEKFPLCFSVEGEAKPLKIGLFQDLAEALADDENVSKTQLRHVLRQYTSNWRYLHGCRLGAERVDLQGNSTGLLSQEEVEHAQQKLAEAKAKFAEKRQAEKKEQMKKRPARKFSSNKTHQDKKAAVVKAKPKLTALSVKDLKQGDNIKVKIGDSAKPASVLEIVKDSARVQLHNGVVMTVSLDNLFA